MTADAPRRPLSPLERWYWILDRISPLNAVARVHVGARIEPDALRRAADALAAAHPLLRVAVRTDADGTHPRFVPTAAPLGIRRVEGDADTWSREVDGHELAHGLDTETGPLARILHVDTGDGTDLVLVAAHIVVDGRGALALLRSLVRAVHAEQTGAGARLAAGTVVGPPEDRLPARFRGGLGTARAVLGMLGGEARVAVRRPRRLPAEQQVAWARRRTRLLRRSLGPDELERLRAACAAHGVTVHGVLGVALAEAVGAELGPGRDGTLTVGCPVDFRDRLTPPVGPEELGAYVAALPVAVGYGPGADPWRTAARINTDLRVRIAADTDLAVITGLRLLSPVSVARADRAARTVEQRGPGNVCLSNMGRFDMPSAVGDWPVSGTQTAAGLSLSGYLVAVANTSHGTLFWNFTYIEGVVPAARAARIADHALRRLRELSA
ncbi:phthiocerol/phthiodiolone dimycocerosyl transferase family protein [Nocardia thailandica]